MRFYYCLYAVAIAILAYSVGLQSIIALIGCLICCLVIFFIYVNLNQNTLPKHRDLITNGRPRFSVDCRLSTIRLPVRRHKAATDFLPDSKQSEKKATISSNNQQKDESFVEFLGQGNRIAPTALYKRPTRAPIIPPHPSYSVVDKTHTWQPKSVGQHHQQPTTSSFISYLQKNDSSDNASTTDRVIIDDITGDPLIDEQLGALLNLFFRDYILTWYRSISSEDNEFPKELYQLIKHSIRSLANQLSKIDKINYITTQLVDELASHLRLYRSALTKLHNELGTNYQSIGMLPSKTSRSGNPKESWNRQLYEYFFDYEYQMEKNVCRNHVCMNKDGFFDYINHICDILENLILPNDCLLNTPLRILCRSVLSNMVLDPFVTCFSEPDYLNQMIVWLWFNRHFYTFIEALRRHR
ncbi:Sorting nexin-13 [Fragariocoptes setiger]|uniref:Sorting nexin-13 n=1 Tax=Fragariocoptes setiger TaxID=1670756 RepID=A0ABQ7SC39_9ACAR|nr:Sorting nexin-13 [Fragariocoptes setiger]